MGTDNMENEEKAKAEETQENTEETVKENAKTELTPEEKYAELNDRFLRLYAEFENFRKRTNKERIDLINNASADVLKEMLPILDDFERAIDNNEKSDDITVIKEGFHLIYNKFKSSLERKGLKVMESKGHVFDSEIHEAIAKIPAGDEEKGKVVENVEKGYYLHDKVIRYAKVVVGE